jgi:hypothetical protein
MNFKLWLESNGEIQGEYWVVEGEVDFADGDIGDRNHEMIATDHIFNAYADAISDLAQELEIDAKEINRYGEVDTEALTLVLGEIHEKLSETMIPAQVDQYIMQNIQCDRDVYLILFGHGDAREYVINHLSWIAIRSNNVELYGYDNNRQKEIAEAVHEILYEESGDEVEDPSRVDLTIEDWKTGKTWYATLEDLEQPQVQPRPAQAPTSTYNRQFFTRQDPEENRYQKPAPGKINPWNTAAQKAGTGSELWRGTSESFKAWIK